MWKLASSVFYLNASLTRSHTFPPRSSKLGFRGHTRSQRLLHGWPATLTSSLLSSHSNSNVPYCRGSPGPQKKLQGNGQVSPSETYTTASSRKNWVSLIFIHYIDCFPLLSCGVRLLRLPWQQTTDGVLDKGNVFPPSSEDWKPATKVQWAGLASSEASLLGLQMATFLLRPHMIFPLTCLCLHLLFLQEHQSGWLKD